MRTFTQGTDIWKKVTEGMKITAYEPPVSFRTSEQLDVIEPGQAVNLPAAERARMNRVRHGVRIKPERL